MAFRSEVRSLYWFRLIVTEAWSPNLQLQHTYLENPVMQRFSILHDREKDFARLFPKQ